MRLKLKRPNKYGTSLVKYVFRSESFHNGKVSAYSTTVTATCPAAALDAGREKQHARYHEFGGGEAFGPGYRECVWHAVHGMNPEGTGENIKVWAREFKSMDVPAGHEWLDEGKFKEEGNKDVKSIEG